MDYLLTSTVTWIRTAGGKGRLQVAPELINVKTGAGAWQQSFDADLTDVFQVQGTIATQVAGALGVALGTREQEQLAERPTKNLAAYDLYLKASPHEQRSGHPPSGGRDLRAGGSARFHLHGGLG